MSESEKYISGNVQEKLTRLSIERLFLLACVVGSLCIIGGVLFSSLILSIFFPLCVMAAYIRMACKGNCIANLAPSKVGDSCYYLGFLLTLVSLVSSLMLLAGSDDIININAIVGGFGAALTTTILGLGARLMITTLKSDSSSARERVEADLERSVDRFAVQITSMTQKVNTALTSISTDIHRINEEVSARYKSSMEQGADRFKASIDNMSNRIDGIEVEPDLITNPVGAALANLVSTIGEHRDSYNDINKEIVQSNEKLSKQLSQSNTLIQGHIESFEMSLANVMKEQSDSFKNSLEEITTSIFSSMGDVKDMKIEVNETLASQLASISTEVDSVREAVSQTGPVVELVNSEFSQISELISKTSANVGSMTKVIENVNRPIFEGSLNLQDSKDTFVELVTKIGEFNKSLGNSIEISNAADSRIYAAANSTSDASIQVANDIREIYSNFADQIRALRQDH